MVFVVGVVLFALGITISVALHECGHMWTAQRLGMKVRRYFIGFGPKVFSFRRGETEYGLKALPLGGFCDIAGMTALDELEPDEIDRAMYRQKTWKRLTVMFGGIAMNFALGFVLIVVLAVGWGLPNLNTPPATALGEMGCVATQTADGTLAECAGEGPAQRAGLQRGDVVTAVAGVPVETWAQFQAQTQQQTGPFTYTVERGGQEMTVQVTPEQVQRRIVDSETGETTHSHGQRDRRRTGLLRPDPVQRGIRDPGVARVHRRHGGADRAVAGDDAGEGRRPVARRHRRRA